MDISTFLACPTCTYNRYIPSWYFFVVFRFIGLCAVAYKRFDIVRLLYIFLAFEVAYFYVWRISLTDLYADEMGLGNRYAWSSYLSGFYESSLIYIFTLWVVSRLKFFRAPGVESIRVRWLFLLIPIFYFIAIVQSGVASNTPSH